jgi:uncharacterized membrane protein YjjP (DUF1212 family)
MSDEDGSGSEPQGQAGAAAAEADEVFGLVGDLAQTLLDWSWEGTVGVDDKIQRVAGSYDHDVETLVGAETAIIQMGDRQALLKGVPGIPPLAALPRMKDWVRDVEAHDLTPVAAREKLRDISATGHIYPPLLRIFGVMMLSFAFAIDIVGTWEACVVAFVTGIASGIFFLLAERSTGWTLSAPLLAAFFVALPIMVAYNQEWVDEVPGVLMLSALFVFIPGDSITVQAVELMDGRWSAGVARLFYSIMMLLLLAIGGLFAAAVAGVSTDLLAPGNATGDFPWWAVYPGHIIFTIGVGLAFQMRWKDIPLATVVTLLVTATAQAGASVFGGTAGTLGASIVMVVVAVFIAQSPNRAPAYVFIITPFFTLTPGSHGLRGFESLIGGQPITGIEDFGNLFATLITIAIGISAGFVLTKNWRIGW